MIFWFLLKIYNKSTVIKVKPMKKSSLEVSVVRKGCSVHEGVPVKYLCKELNCKADS